MRLIPILFLLLALSGCGLLPEQSYSVPNTATVLRYPILWTVSQNADRHGLITVFSPDAKPRLASTRITLQAATAAPKPRSGGASLTNLTLTEDLGLSPEGLHACRFFVTQFPNAWAIEVYAPPADFATIRATAERMAKALNAPAAPGPKK